MPLFDVYPLNNITITKADGSYVWDDKEHKYLDMYGGHAVISIGHSHSAWKERINAQLDKIAFYSNSIYIPIQHELADKLTALSSKTSYQLFLVNSGAEANENALKLASFHSGRKKVVAFTNAFHGRTSLAVSATDNPKIIAPVNETENIHFLPLNDEDALQDFFKNHGNEIAAVLIEAIQGVGGIRIANHSFLKVIRELCKEYNVVFIADEVQCGYGRTGNFFATDAAGLNADIYTMAKGMGNGFPIGGILIAPHITPKHGMLGTTFGGNHLACAAALAVLEVLDQEQLQSNARELGTYLMKELAEIKELQNVRGAGLMIGFDVDQKFKDLRKILLEKYKIFTGEAKPNVIRLLPALSLTKKDCDHFLDNLKRAIEDCTTKKTLG